MPYGYLGQNQPNQTVSNSGVFSITDVAELQSQGKLGGSLELIEEKSISAVSSAIFTDIKETKYDVHYLQVDNFANSDIKDIRIRFYESGVEESASVYQYAYQYGQADGSFADTVRSTAIDHILGTFVVGNATNQTGSAYCYFYNLGNSSKYSFQTMQQTSLTNTSVYRMAFGGGVLPQASTVDQIKLFVTSGTFSATAKLYGVKQIWVT